MINGLNVTFSFKLGDGSETLEPSEQSQIRHIYDQPGSYVVSMEATNPITGSITVSEVGMLKVIYRTRKTMFDVICQNEGECFITGSKHRKTDESKIPLLPKGYL